nr:transglutaminase-like domain-containing protein [uncultured Rhodoferax sp.]
MPAFFSSTANPYLTELRTRYSLDVVANAKTSDFDRVLAVANWVRGRWEHNGVNTPQNSDPISILQEASNGKQFRCVEYSIVLWGALAAVGYPSRILGLMTADVETREYGAGHVVTEVYLPDLAKWVMVDGQWNVIPLIAGKPVSALELAQALASKTDALSVASFASTDAQAYFQWVKPYLYYFTASLDNSFFPHPNGRSIRLAPLGAKEPLVFQRKYPMSTALLTHKAALFYPSPTLLGSVAE